MTPKLTLEQFREIKNSMMNLQDLLEQNDWTNKIEVERLAREFSSLQDKLLSSDLSDIPFEEWQGLVLNKEELDLSKTHANIDFSLLDGISYDTINIQGCNVKGIQAIDYDETTFDEEFIKANPEYFPDKSIPEDVRKKYYDKKLEFSDLIEYPALRRYVNENSFDKFSSSSNLVELIGFENAIRLFDENPVFVNAITEPGRGYSVFDSIKTNDNSSDKPKNYEEAKQVVYREVIDVVEKGRAHLPSLNDLPQEMIDSFPNIFIKEGELPDEVVKHYYEGGLSIREIKNYSEVLKTKDLEFGTHYSSEINGVNKVFGDVWKFLEQVPVEYYDIVGRYLSKIAYDEEKISQIQKQELSGIISESIKNYLNDGFRERSNLDELYSFSKYVPIEEIFEDENLRLFVQKCGFENLIDFNRKNNMLLDSSVSSDTNTIQQMAKHVSVIEENDNQELATIFGKIIHEMRLNDHYYDRDVLEKNKREFSSLCPSEFIDYNLLDTLLKDMNEEDKEKIVKKLEDGFNGDENALFEILNKNQFLISALENKNLIIKDWRFRNLYQQFSNNKFLEFFSKYGNAILDIDNITGYTNEIHELLLKMNDNNYEEIMTQCVYNLIGNNVYRSFDLRVLPQSFKTEHPELFLDENAPKELQDVFYVGRLLDAQKLQEHPEWFPFLLKIDLSKCLANKDVYVYNLNGQDDNYQSEKMNLYKALEIKFSKEEIFDLISKYGKYLDKFDFDINLSLSKEGQYQNIIREIYDSIKKNHSSYSIKNMPREFIEKYPNLFLDENAPKELQDAFYSRTLTSPFLLSHPEYRKYLNDVDLDIIFKNIPVNMKPKDGDESIIKFGPLGHRRRYRQINFVNALEQSFGKQYALNIMLIYGNYVEELYNSKVLEDFLFDSNLTPNEFLNELDKTIYQGIIDGKIKYDESIPSHFKNDYPSLFLGENVSQEIKDKFYNREFTLKDFEDNPNLIDVFDNTNIACAFPENMAWIISLFNNLKSIKNANYNRLKVILEYSKIDDYVFQNIFKEYVLKDGDNINSERIDLISEVLSKLSLSNSSEILSFRKELTTQVLNSKDPLDSLSKIEDIFEKNNIPTVGKVYACFETLHPDFQGFNFGDYTISPVLKRSSTMAKKITVFSDLIKCSFGSNNRSVNSYLNNIEVGYSLYEGIKSGQIKFESLKEEEIKELTIFSNHLTTLYNNTLKAKNENDTFKSTGNVLIDILNLSKKTSPNGALDYNLADRIIRMFCGFAGIDTLAQAKNYIEKKIKNADSRNRNASNYNMTLEQGDFIKGLCPTPENPSIESCIEVLPKILQNGSVSKEYLGSAAGSDNTPLDTDLSIIMSNDGTISEKMSNIAAASYGPIWLVLKNDDRFITTRTSSKTLEVKRDLSKMEAFHTGYLGEDHYGIRTGFASSEINYIVMENYDPRVGLEIAMNGFYIPVANKEGKIIFTPEEYDKLRTKMSGLSYYGLPEYNISNNLDAPGISDTKERLLANVEKTNGYNLRIRNTIKNALIESGVPIVIDGFSGNLSLGMSEIYSTGSTARNTNVPNDSDFDFLIKIDRDTYYNSGKLDEFKDKMKKILGFNDGFGGKICGEIVLDGQKQDVEISICPRTDKVDFSTDVSLSSKLDAIKEQYPEKYVDVLSNIVFAKEFFKNDTVNAYKSLKSDSTQGGLGGIGIENWILQNGGSFVDAAKDFVETADKAKSFEEFKRMYQVYDFGSNHYSDKKGIYAHDNFVGDENKMGKEGYERIHQALKEYLESLEISQNENNSKKR